MIFRRKAAPEPARVHLTADNKKRIIKAILATSHFVSQRNVETAFAWAQSPANEAALSMVLDGEANLHFICDSLYVARK